MKIGIITVQKAPNFGAQLQCYALFKYLQELGHEVEVIDLLRPFHAEYIESVKYRPFKFKRDNNKVSVFRKKIKTLLKLILSSKYRNERKKKKRFDALHEIDYIRQKELFAEFDKKIHFSKIYYSIDELYENPPSYDLYLTGSDQLWNPTQPYCVEPYFLTFVKNCGKKASYATSVGLSELPNELLKKYINWLESYEKVSVREQTMVSLLENNSGLRVERMIDPTFLIDVRKWENMSLDNQYDNYLFYFSLTNDIYPMVEILETCKKKGLKLLYWERLYKQKIEDENALGISSISPEEWLGLIKNAEYVITDSFHCVVFSILFKKGFYSFIPENNGRGSRITDLLSLMGLEGRLIKDNYSHLALEEVDYSRLDQIIEKERHKAASFFETLTNK